MSAPARRRPLIAFEQSACNEDSTHASALRNTLALAQRCEQAGYHRFWVSEHHNNPAIVGSAPEILLGALSVLTSRMRIGAAGVLLPFYAPFKVAEQFSVLEALAPGRIDLGLGRSPGGDGRSFNALNPGASGDREEFEQKIRELMCWLRGETPAVQADVAGLKVLPRNPGCAQPWLLATSVAGAESAASLGLPLCFNYSAEQSVGCVEQAFAAYRQAFRPGSLGAQPYTAVMVWALAADTDEHARYLFGPRALWRTRLDDGVRAPLVTPAQAQAHSFTAAQRERIAQQMQPNLVGTPQDVMARLHQLADRVQADEIGITCWTHAPQDRIRSFELLAAAHGL
ncbi:LLM class flavin-dependent oxidoreductase [Herbaspirillum autotrophicum]|uniref:LLM class flavin-dependent oxidoreductase n=1 Tax=Herbaspirillum autotrophicum TaxID=180195 RepID=UPI0009FA7416|nr:LLM class flavin-dependent oxidoreductase [Herbaspirillum autotrophicum]